MRLLALGISPLMGGRAGPPQPTVLFSSVGSFPENITNGTTLGTLSCVNVTGTPVYTLLDTDVNRVTLSGSTISRGALPWDYETHPLVSFTVSVTGTTPAVTARTFTIDVTNVLETILAALGLSPSTIAEGSTADTVVGTITGKTSGSSLALTDDAGGRFAISGTNLVTGSTLTDYETSTLHAITIRETHSDAAPRDTALAVTVTNVAEGSEPGPFTLAWTSATTELTNLSFSLTPAPLVGDVVTLSLDGNSDMSSPFDTSDPNTVDSGEAGSGTLTFTGIATPLATGLTYARVNVVRGVYSVDSTIASITLTGGVAYAGPGDIVSGANIWGGLRAYNAATAGTAAIRIRASGDNAETDINTTAAGALDVAAVSSFLTTHGGNAFVTKLYDKSGNGRDLIQATAANQPQLVLSGLGSLPVLRFVQGNSTALQTAGSVARPQPYTHSLVVKRTGNFAGYAAAFGELSLYTGFPPSANSAFIYAGTVATFSQTDNVMHTIQGAYEGATSAVYVDGASVGAINPGVVAIAATVYRVGDSNSSSYLTGDICEVGDWLIKFDATQAANMDANQSAYWGI